jgi:hypothetical protein
MFKLNDKYLYVSICSILVILFVIGFIIWIYKNNNISTNNSNENFADIVPLTSDELLEKLKLNPEGLQEVVVLDNLIEIITNLVNSKISENNKGLIDNLPVGTIIIWEKEELPSDKWSWCDGQNNTPDLKYRFPLGGKDYSNEIDKPEGKNDGLIEQNNVPKHRHPLNGERDDEKFPKINHSHDGTTKWAGNHSHWTYVPKSGYDGADGDRCESSNHKKAHGYIDAGGSSNGAHQHAFETGAWGWQEEIDGKIKEFIIGEGPVYEGEQKPFYPIYTLVNFIIKVK